MTVKPELMGLFGGKPTTPEPSKEGGDRLKIELTLNIAGTDYKIIGGHIKNLELALRSYGFWARVDFIVIDDKPAGGKTEDKLYTDFIKKDLAKATLTVRAIYPDHPIDDGAEPLKLTGLVIEKAYSDIVYKEVKGDSAALARHYFITFIDAAQHLWRQHYPCELFTQKTMKDVIDAQKPDQITLTYNWPELTTTRPLLFLGHEPGSGKASFYDFLIWYVDTRGGIFTFKYQDQKFDFAADKDMAARKVKLYQDDVAGFRLVFPEVVRHKVRIHNSYTEGAQTKEIDQDAKQAPIKQDYLLDTPVAAQVDARETLEKARLIVRQNELTISLKRFPADPIAPGDFIEFTNNEYWMKSIKPLPKPVQGQTMRVFAFDLRAKAFDDTPDYRSMATDAGYTIEGTLKLELKTEKHVKLPDYIRPHYPRHIEGKIVSEVGAEDELTYQIYTDADTSVEQYKVKIALFADQEIFVPFNPNLFPGHYYFPAYKTQRVLIAFEFEHAWLKRFLDWRPEGRLAADTQGNHLLVGKKPLSSTSVKHVYGEDKPEFQILRTHEKDVQTIHIKEGYMLIEVKEKK